jgi:hypothetical protein
VERGSLAGSDALVSPYMGGKGAVPMLAPASRRGLTRVAARPFTRALHMG